MLEIFYTANKNVHKKVKIAIARHICGSFEVKVTENGKPYVEGNPLFFSISHSKNTAVFALSDEPVGIDFEFVDEKRSVKNVLSRFTEREKSEIDENLNAFYANWVAKEAYVKLIGGSLAHDLKKLEYAQKTLFYDGKKVGCNIALIYPENSVICVIYGGVEHFDGKTKRFRLKRGESINER